MLRREEEGTCMRGTILGLLTAACVLALAAPAAADAPPAGSAWTEATFASRDGTRLHADVFRPVATAAPVPVMLVVSPYLRAESPPKVLRWYRRLYDLAIAHGYAVVQVSLRGSGASAGCSDLGGPGEQGDVAAALAWAAAQPWSTGRVGMAGHSYDGFAAVIGLAQHPPELAAAVVMAPAIDLYRGAYMNGVPYFQGRGVGAYYQGLGLVPPLSPGDAPSAIDPACAPDVVARSQEADPETPFWRERDMSARAAGSTIPVLWSHGFLDGRDDFSAVRPDNFLDVWSRLNGPRRAWFGQFPHVVPGEHNTWDEPEPVGRDGFPEEAVAWLDAYVRGRDGRAGAGEVLVQDGASGAWRAEPRWPPAGTRPASLALRPGAYTDDAGTKAEQGDGPGGGCAEGVRARCNPLSRTGRGAWTFSEPLPRDVRLSGVSRIELALHPGADGTRVVALVYDVDPDGRASLLTRGASLVPAGGRFAFDLYPQDWRLVAGHRVGVLLSGSDDFYFEPGTTGARVEVLGGTLALPVATPRTEAPAGGPSRAVLERTTFAVDAAGPGSPLALPPDGPGLRLVRVCTRPGRLVVRVRGAVERVRSVAFRVGARRVGTDRRAPFRRVVARRTLLRTRAVRLRAVIRLRGGERAVLVRTLPRCGLRRR
jgi:uncharacterized protein